MVQRNQVPQQNNIQLMFGVYDVIYGAEQTKEDLISNFKARAKTTNQESLKKINARIQELLDYYQQLKLAAIDAKLISSEEISQIEEVACKNMKQFFYPDYQRQFQQQISQIQQQTEEKLQEQRKKETNMSQEMAVHVWTNLFTVGGAMVAAVIFPPLLAAYFAIEIMTVLDCIITVGRLIAQAITANNIKASEPEKISSLQQEMQNNLLLNPELKCRQRLFQLEQTCAKEKLQLEKKEPEETNTPRMLKASA